MFFLSWGSINTVCIISLLAQKHPSSLINKRHYLEQTYTYNRIFSYPIPKASASGRTHSKHHAIFDILVEETRNSNYHFHSFQTNTTRMNTKRLDWSRDCIRNRFIGIWPSTSCGRCSFSRRPDRSRSWEGEWWSGRGRFPPPVRIRNRARRRLRPR